VKLRVATNPPSPLCTFFKSFTYKITGLTVFFTYIIKSNVNDKHYYGHTNNNLNKRLTEHNSGLPGFTKRYIPWDLIYFESFNSRSETIKRLIILHRQKNKLNNQ